MKGNSIFTKWFICSILVVGHLVGLQAQNRLTLEDAQEIAKEREGECLSTEYKNALKIALKSTKNVLASQPPIHMKNLNNL